MDKLLKKAIKKHAIEMSVEDYNNTIDEMLQEEHFQLLEDASLDGIMMDFNGIAENDIETYFNNTFGYYSPSDIFTDGTRYAIALAL